MDVSPAGAHTHLVAGIGHGGKLHAQGTVRGGATPAVASEPVSCAFALKAVAVCQAEAKEGGAKKGWKSCCDSRSVDEKVGFLPPSLFSVTCGAQQSMM